MTTDPPAGSTRTHETHGEAAGVLKKWKRKRLYQEWQDVSPHLDEPVTFEEWVRRDALHDRYIRRRRARFNTITLHPDEVPAWGRWIINDSLGPTTVQLTRKTARLKFTNTGWLASEIGYSILRACGVAVIATLLFHFMFSLLIDRPSNLTFQMVVAVVMVALVAFLYSTLGPGRSVQVNRYPQAGETFRYLLSTLGEDTWPDSIREAEGAWKAFMLGEGLLHVGGIDDAEADKFFAEARTLADQEKQDQSTDR